MKDLVAAAITECVEGAGASPQDGRTQAAVRGPEDLADGPDEETRARLGGSLAHGPPRETRSTGQERFEVAEELVHDVAHLHIPGIHERPRCAPRQAGTAGVLLPEDGVRCR